MRHYSVLKEECINGLNIFPDGIYIDGTLGRAGHSSEILKKLNHGHLYAFDRDLQAIEESYERLAEISKNFTLIHSNFSMLKEQLKQYGITQFDGMLLDLGVSSPQFDEASRGFSYRYDAPLDMRMDQSQSLTAYDVVNTYTYQELVSIFYRYADESFAKNIARKIEAKRQIHSIQTTFELVDVVKSALPAKVLNKKGHPAKKVFQAIRMEVNNELYELKQVLEDAISMLACNGRLCVITFHSIEDRLVKEIFNKYTKPEKVDKRIPLLSTQVESLPYRLVNRKPIVANAIELEENNRSHSAKLRIIERIR